MKRKFINVTKEYIENLAPTDFCVELIQPAWETVNIYGSYEEYEESLKTYTIEQRYLLAMHWLGAEVANGGFQQFLSNSTGIVWEDAYKGYQAIGSEKLAYLIEELIKVYGRDIPFDREERGNILDSFSQEKLAEIDALTDLYYEIEEPEWRKVTLWVKANSEKFFIQAEINDYSSLFIFYNFANACSMSAIISFIFSIPTLILTASGNTPHLIKSSSLNCL